MTNESNDAFEHRVQVLEYTTRDLDDRVTELDKNTAVSLASISKSLEILSKLPDSYNSMEKTMIAMQAEISNAGVKTDSLEKKVDSLSQSIKSIDEDGKVNIRKYLKDNWFKVVIAISAVLGLGALLIGNGTISFS